jgi:hypothetical protein
MVQTKRALVCCPDDQRSHEIVRSVLGECDKEENHGNEWDPASPVMVLQNNITS